MKNDKFLYFGAVVSFLILFVVYLFVPNKTDNSHDFANPNTSSNSVVRSHQIDLPKKEHLQNKKFLMGQQKVVRSVVEKASSLEQIKKNIVQKKSQKISLEKNNKTYHLEKEKIASKPTRYPSSVKKIDKKMLDETKFYVPKDVFFNLGQSNITFNQKSETTDADSSFSVQNFGLGIKFQGDESFFVDVEGFYRSSTVQSAGEFSDYFMSIRAGTSWEFNNLPFSVFSSAGIKYSGVNYFEQNFNNNVESFQDSVISANAEIGISAEMGSNMAHKLRLNIDVGNLNQFGIKYDSRYRFDNSKWFVDLSGAYYDGDYQLNDQFNQKQVNRSDVQLLLGIGRSFK